MRPVCLHTIFSTLYTTLPHNLIKDKLVDLIERTFQRECSLSIAYNDKNAFFTSDAVRSYNLWSSQKVCEALTFLLDNIYIRFDSKLYRQFVGIPMCTNCAPLVADLFCSVMRETSCSPFRGVIETHTVFKKLKLVYYWSMLCKIYIPCKNGRWYFPGCLRLGLSWFNWWVSFAPEFQCCYFCEPSCLFYLSFNFDFYVSKIMHL